MPTTTAADASASEPLDSPRTLFLNAQLVGRPAGRYSVLVQGGVIVSMSRGAILDIEDDMEIVDLELEGKQLWLSPVSPQQATQGGRPRLSPPSPLFFANAPLPSPSSTGTHTLR